MNSDVALCVDLDGTLIKSDVLIEGALLLLKRNIFYVFLLFIWCARGKAYLKSKVAENSEIDPSVLPYNKKVLAYLREQAKSGRKIILVTAAHTAYAEGIANYLEIFDDFYATDEVINLAGKNKAKLLVQKYGSRNFDYIGNSFRDLPVWECSRNAILVSSNSRLERLLTDSSQLTLKFTAHKISLKNYIKAFRVHQWVKNLLIFVPLLASHQFRSGSLLIDCIIAFFAFSFCASSIYVMNDLFDLNADRKHPEKCQRMFASGELPLIHGVLLCPVLLIIGFILASVLPYFFSAGLVGYIVLTFLYTTFLKSIIAIDVFILSTLFTYRILLGSIVTMIVPSFWLLAFSMFIFLSLALCKRYSELHTVLITTGEKMEGRGYKTSDLTTILAQGTASAYAATLVLALYINDSSVGLLYPTPFFLWGLCILLLYWVTRLWLKCARGEIQSDPIVFAVTDWQSVILAFISALLVYLAALPDLYG